MKKQRAAERAAKQAAEKGPAKETSDVDHSKIFGVPPLIRSETREGKNYVQMGQIGEKFKEGDTILVRGRVDNVRGKGNLCFVVLRQRVSTIQCVIAKSNGNERERKREIRYHILNPFFRPSKGDDQVCHGFGHRVHCGHSGKAGKGRAKG